MGQGASRWVRPFDRRARVELRRGEIVRINLKADKIHAQRGAGDGGVADAHERIEHTAGASHAVQPDAQLRNARWKAGRVRALFVAALDRLVGHEPCVAGPENVTHCICITVVC